MKDLMLTLADFITDGERYMLVDVRDEAEFSERHIPGSVNIPLSTLQSDDFSVPEDKVAVTVCGKGGGRSAEAAARLRAMGLDKAAWLEFGMNGWFKEKET